jgi:syntaxin-binding protein 1
MHLGVPIIQGENVKPGKSLTPKEREEETYTDSRWSPIIRDIIEYAAEGKLDDSYCPYISKKSRASSSNIASASVTSTTSTAGASSVRKRYDWIPKSDQKETKSIGLSSFGFGGGATPTMSKKDVPTIFIFIIGGMTYSEMRTMHKVAQTHRNYDFVIGSTHIISPTRFLGDVRKLPSFMRL